MALKRIAPKQTKILQVFANEPDAILSVRDILIRLKLEPTSSELNSTSSTLSRMINLDSYLSRCYMEETKSFMYSLDMTKISKEELEKIKNLEHEVEGPLTEKVISLLVEAIKLEQFPGYTAKEVIEITKGKKTAVESFLSKSYTEGKLFRNKYYLDRWKDEGEERSRYFLIKKEEVTSEQLEMRKKIKKGRVRKIKEATGFDPVKFDREVKEAALLPVVDGVDTKQVKQNILPLNVLYDVQEQMDTLVKLVLQNGEIGKMKNVVEAQERKIEEQKTRIQFLEKQISDFLNMFHSAEKSLNTKG